MPSSAASSVRHLRDALDALAGALAVADTQALVAVEERLLAALAAVSKLRDVEARERAEILDEILKARVALDRCRYIGTTLTRAIDTCLGIGRHAPVYGAAGVVRVADRRRVVVRMRA